MNRRSRKPYVRTVYAIILSKSFRNPETYSAMQWLSYKTTCLWGIAYAPEKRERGTTTYVYVVKLLSLSQQQRERGFKSEFAILIESIIQYAFLPPSFFAARSIPHPFHTFKFRFPRPRKEKKVFPPVRSLAPSWPFIYLSRGLAGEGRVKASNLLLLLSYDALSPFSLLLENPFSRPPLSLPGGGSCGT